MAPGGADGVGVGNIMIKRERVLLNINYCSTKQLILASFHWSVCVLRLSSSPARGNSFRKTAINTGTTQKVSTLVITQMK